MMRCSDMVLRAGDGAVPAWTWSVAIDTYIDQVRQAPSPAAAACMLVNSRNHARNTDLEDGLNFSTCKLPAKPARPRGTAKAVAGGSGAASKVHKNVRHRW